MENSTGKNVLKKTFTLLDEVIEEKKQVNSSEADMLTETADSCEGIKTDTTVETVAERE